MPDLFRIRGGDRKEYGPVTAPEVVAWVRDGRADRATPTRDETSTVWSRLNDFPDLAAALPPAAPEGRPLSSGPTSAQPPTPEEILTRPYRLSVLDCLADGWQLLCRQPGAVLGSGILAATLVIVLGLASLIPYVAFLTLPTAFLLSGPLYGGLSWLSIRAWRGTTMRARDALEGLRHRFLPLLIAFHSVTLLALLALIPGISLVSAGISHGAQAQTLTPPTAIAILSGLALTVLSTATVVAVWGFAPALVMDRNLGVRDALRLSRRTVLRRPFRNLRLAHACGILLFGGILCFGVGILFTLPWVVAIRARAYDELFGPRHAPAA